MPTLPPAWRVEPLAASHNKKSFACGVDSLDHYLKNQASQDLRRHVAMPFALVETATGKLAGYYTLSATSIDAGEIPPDIARKLPRYSALPATLLGRLAIDQSYQGKGLGAALLTNALLRSHRNTEEIGSVAVVVDALDAGAVKFYKSFGFTPFLSMELRLFMPMSTIGALKT